MKSRLVISVALIFLLVMGLTSLAFRPGRAQTPTATFEPPAPFQTISVSGNGQADVQPDMAVVLLGVNTQARSASDAIASNNQKMQAVISAIQTAGIRSQDLQTQVLQLQPQYPPPDNQGVISQTITGYVADNMIQVKVRDLTQVGDILDEGLKAGANRIDNISFQVSDPVSAQDQARATAMSDARHKADQLAALANAHLGDVISISEEAVSPIPFARGLAAPQAAGVPIEVGTNTVTVVIRVTWALVPGGAGTPFPLGPSTLAPVTSATPFTTGTPGTPTATPTPFPSSSVTSTSTP